jgi:hypothetical protein
LQIADPIPPAPPNTITTGFALPNVSFFSTGISNVVAMMSLPLYFFFP